MSNFQVCTQCYQKFNQLLEELVEKTKKEKIQVRQSNQTTQHNVQTSIQSLYGSIQQINQLLQKFFKEILEIVYAKKFDDLKIKLKQILSSSSSSDLTNIPILERIDNYISNKPQQNIRSMFFYQEKQDHNLQKLFDTLKDNDMSDKYGFGEVDKEVEEKYFSAKERSTSQGQYSKKLDDLLKFKRIEENSSMEISKKSEKDHKTLEIKNNSEQSKNNFLGFPLKPKMPSKKKFYYFNRAEKKNQKKEKKDLHNKSVLQVYQNKLFMKEPRFSIFFDFKTKLYSTILEIFPYFVKFSSSVYLVVSSLLNVLWSNSKMISLFVSLYYSKIHFWFCLSLFSLWFSIFFQGFLKKSLCCTPLVILLVSIFFFKLIKFLLQTDFFFLVKLICF